MPTDATILGFGNRWYPTAIATASTLRLGANLDIRVVTPPLFIATKIEAFEGRGKGDFYGSHDLEDIIAVIDGRESLIDELQESDADLKRYIAHHFRRYVESLDFRNALPGFIPSESPARESIIHDRIGAICVMDM